MEGEQSELEVVIATITVGSALEEADLVVGSFQRAGRDRMVIPVQQSGTMSSQGVGHGS